MKICSKFLLAGSSFAVAGMLVGCQLPFTSTHEKPRVIVHYGDIKINPDADLAVVVKIGPEDEKRGYSLKGLASAGITRLVVKVSGKNLAADRIGTVDVSGDTCTATINFTDLPIGQVDVVVQALDASGNTVVWGTSTTKIAPGTTATATVKCDGQKGNLAVNFECTQLCGAPPVPPPPPAIPNPFNPSGFLASATGFSVDKTGNIYIFGEDPTSAQAGTVFPVTPQGHRIYKVPGDLVSPGKVVYDNCDLIAEGDFRADNNSLNMFDGYGKISVDLATDSASVVTQWPWPGYISTNQITTWNWWGSFKPYRASFIDNSNT